MLKRGSAQKALGEFAVIVLGVLVAFQVESWAESNRQSVRERSQLEALAADFEENHARLLRNIEFQERVLRCLGTVLSIVNGDTEVPEPDSLSSLLVISQMYARFEPITGAYDALLASGDIGVLSSQELRAQLAGFFGAAGDGFEDERISDLCHLELYRVAARLIPVYRTLPEGRRRSIGFTGAVAPVDWDAVLGDQEFVGLLAYVGQLEGNQIGYFRALEQRIQGISNLLGEQLANT